MAGFSKFLRTIARNIIYWVIINLFKMWYFLPFPRRLFISGSSIVRWAMWKAKLKSFGDGSKIYPKVVIHIPQNVSIGSNVAIAEYVHMWGAGSVEIGNNVLIGSHSVITSLTHNPDCNARRKALIRKPVRINDSVWIGSGSIILPGITIGEGAVIAAGSVVTRDIPPHQIYAGIPAKFLRNVLYEE